MREVLLSVDQEMVQTFVAQTLNLSLREVAHVGSLRPDAFHLRTFGLEHGVEGGCKPDVAIDDEVRDCQSPLAICMVALRAAA